MVSKASHERFIPLYARLLTHSSSSVLEVAIDGASSSQNEILGRFRGSESCEGINKTERPTHAETKQKVKHTDTQLARDLLVSQLFLFLCGLFVSFVLETWKSRTHTGVDVRLR